MSFPLSSQFFPMHPNAASAITPYNVIILVVIERQASVTPLKTEPPPFIGTLYWYLWRTSIEQRTRRVRKG
jgi:hypothetical protein